MRALLKFLFVLILIAAVVFGIGYFWAGRQPGPTITIAQPQKYVGQGGSLEIRVESPGGRVTSVEAVAEQNGRRMPVFSLADPTQAQVKQETADRFYISRPFGKKALPDLRQGTLTLTVTASRPVFFNLRQARSTATRELQVRLEPPRVAVLSTHHYVNHGGAELVVYRAQPADVESGVRVGDITYPGYPISGAGGPDDPTLRVAFFALLYEQDLNTPMSVHAKDAAGNQAVQTFGDKVFPKPFARSRIELTDSFLNRVVPAIAANSPQIEVSTATPQDVLNGFLKINGELRRIDNDIIAGLAAKTSPRMLWTEPFRQMASSQVEARFADQRTYVYQGKEVDRQVHLGLDLARTAQVEIVAANRGTVIYASDLGIYGNCVVIDHGMGVQSLYGHLSSIDVKVGDTVAKDQALGRSGQTGLAGGDHLHFTMLVNGHPVNPVEWWDAHWIQDRIVRKLRDAGAHVPAAPSPTAATDEPAAITPSRRLHRRGA